MRRGNRRRFPTVDSSHTAPRRRDPRRENVSGQALFTPLDILELELDPPAFATRFQCENRLMQNWNWRLAGRANAAEVLKYCSKEKNVLHGPGKTVQPSDLQGLPPQKWTSLELVHATNATFEPDPRTPIRWQARFSSGPAGPAYCLSITDPEATFCTQQETKNQARLPVDRQPYRAQGIQGIRQARTLLQTRRRRDRIMKCQNALITTACGFAGNAKYAYSIENPPPIAGHSCSLPSHSCE